MALDTKVKKALADAIGAAKERVAERNNEVKKQVVHDIEIIRGEKLTIPEKASIDDCILALQRKAEHEEQMVDILDNIKTFVWEGALALAKAIENKCGWVESQTQTIEGFFGSSEIRPKLIKVEVGPNETKLVPWGQFTLPGISGEDCVIETGTGQADGQIIFSVKITCKRKYENRIREIMNEARRIAKEESIYQGKALKVRFFEMRDGERVRIPLPMPSFLDVSKVKESEVIFSDDTDVAIRTSIYTILEHPEECASDNIPKKRGILLAGPFGTGKTLVAYITAQKATAAGRTFILCEKADELDEVVQFSRSYDNCVVFCEDIDLVFSGDRTEEINNKMNQIDGIESKGGNTLLIFTTNHVDKIYKGMIRPGRIDDTIYIGPPDAKAIERLIRLYGSTRIEPNEDITDAVKYLVGNIPAVVQEVVERSKLYAIQSRNPGKITAQNLLHAARSMQFQLSLLNGTKEDSTKDAIISKLADTNTAISEAVRVVVNHKPESQPPIYH